MPEHDARDAALVWFTRLHSGEATSADRAAFREWLAVRPAHRREYDRLAAVWSSLDRLGDRRLFPSPSDGPVRSGAMLTRRRFMIGGAAVAGLGAATVAAVESGLPDALGSDYYTRKGELRTVTLADSSQVALDADSAFSLAFTPTERRVRLQRGRALFEVAKDPVRPFSVEARDGLTTALGTQFVVNLLPDGVAVSVLESAVTVTAPGGADGRSQVRVAEGQIVSYDRHGLGRVRPAQDNAATAWRRGRLIFENQPLGDVLAELSRYRSGTIVTTARSLLELRVSGVFDISDPDHALDAIRRTLPVRTLELTRYLVILRPA